MKVLLLRPKPDVRSLGLTNLIICEPIELEYASARLKQDGHEVVLIDFFLEKEDIAALMSAHKPDMVGTTAYITHVNVVKRYAKEVKNCNKNCIFVVGGVHAEVVPEDLVDPNVDFILSNNALEQVADIANKKIRKQNEIVTRPRRHIINKLEAYFPDREITSKYRHKYDYLFHVPCALLKTSFGCPYQCEFCFCRQITDTRYEERDIKSVIEEIKVIKEPNIFIVDDDFLINRRRVQEFCSLLDKEKIKKKFIIFGRADFVIKNEDIISLLAEHNFVAVFVGLESFRQADLDNHNKKTTVAMNEQAVRTLTKYNLDCYAGAMVGPDWEKSDFRNFVSWAHKIGLQFINIQPLTPLPGTPLFEKEKHRLIVNRNQHELWDLTHVVIRPTKMSIRDYYLEIVKAYLQTTASLKTAIYIKNKYGWRIALHCFKGASFILFQYLKLAWKN